jgi:hypothetical protein
MPTIKQLKEEITSKAVQSVAGKKKSELMAMLHGEKTELKPKEDTLPEKPVTKKIKAPTKTPSTELQNKLTMAAVRAHKKTK